MPLQRRDAARRDSAQDRTADAELGLDRAFDKRGALGQRSLLGDHPWNLADTCCLEEAAFTQARQPRHEVSVHVVAHRYDAQADLVLAHLRQQIVILDVVLQCLVQTGATFSSQTRDGVRHVLDPNTLKCVRPHDPVRRFVERQHPQHVSRLQGAGGQNRGFLGHTKPGHSTVVKAHTG